jgi:very-short-patch-repair endonuclease
MGIGPLAARSDEYGNPQKTDRHRERGRAPTIGNLRAASRYRGGVPYQAFRTGRRTRSGIGPTKDQPFPDPPSTWTGTLPEWAIYWAHLAIGRKPFQDFQYQYSFDGNKRFDFFDFAERVAIEVEGLYWHYMFQKAQSVNDQLRKIQAESVGYTLIFIDEDHALANPVFYLREALAERDHSRAATGRSI